jgi:DNA-binding response OmpR family regulator
MMPAEAKILIVDDEPPVCRSLASALSGRSYIVDTALNGEEALEKERENHYDVVVADLMMPGISGMDLLKTLKKDRPEVMVIQNRG